MIAGAVAAFAGWLVLATWDLPRDVERASELESLVGYRVRMTAGYDGDYKAYDLLYFDGETLMVDHVNGSFEWPKTGQSISVTGRLRRYGYPGSNARFAVVDATWEF